MDEVVGVLVLKKLDDMRTLYAESLVQARNLECVFCDSGRSRQLTSSAWGLMRQQTLTTRCLRYLQTYFVFNAKADGTISWNFRIIS